MTREPRYFSGLDLGRASEFTALAVLEQTQEPDPEQGGRAVRHYAVRHLERFALGTPYADIFSRVKTLFAEPRLGRSALVVDSTGVGKPVVDLLRRARTGA